MNLYKYGCVLFDCLHDSFSCLNLRKLTTCFLIFRRSKFGSRTEEPNTSDNSRREKTANRRINLETGRRKGSSLNTKRRRKNLTWRTRRRPTSSPSPCPPHFLPSPSFLLYYLVGCFLHIKSSWCQCTFLCYPSPSFFPSFHSSFLPTFIHFLLLRLRRRDPMERLISR